MDVPGLSDSVEDRCLSAAARRVENFVFGQFVLSGPCVVYMYIIRCKTLTDRGRTLEYAAVTGTSQEFFAALFSDIDVIQMLFYLRFTHWAE